MRSQQWLDGRRNGIKWSVEFLHKTSKGMHDPHARMILEMAASILGRQAKRAATAEELWLVGQLSAADERREETP